VVKQAARIVPLESLVDLQALLNPAVVEQVLDAFWRRHGEHPGLFTIILSNRLHSIGRHIGLHPEQLEQLDEFRAELARFRPLGMTSKNQALVRQVTNPKVFTSIVSLPERLMRDARQMGEHAPVKAGITAQIAVAIAILTIAPIRLGNLGRTRIGENLIKPAGLREVYWLVFPEHDVKNNVPLEFELDSRVTELVDEYLENFRPALVRASNPVWLFPGEDSGHKVIEGLAAQITQRIRSTTGVRITPHQFRHAAAAIFLKHYPGHYEQVRRLLGHRSISTTTQYYCGLETTQASEIYGNIVRRQLATEEY
jgi:hypothetical protein